MKEGGGRRRRGWPIERRMGWMLSWTIIRQIARRPCLLEFLIVHEIDLEEKWLFIVFFPGIWETTERNFAFQIKIWYHYPSRLKNNQKQFTWMCYWRWVKQTLVCMCKTSSVLRWRKLLWDGSNADFSWGDWSFRGITIRSSENQIEFWFYLWVERTRKRKMKFYHFWDVIFFLSPRFLPWYEMQIGPQSAETSPTSQPPLKTTSQYYWRNIGSVPFGPFWNQSNAFQPKVNHQLVSSLAEIVGSQAFPRRKTSLVSFLQRFKSVSLWRERIFGVSLAVWIRIKSSEFRWEINQGRNANKSPFDETFIRNPVHCSSQSSVVFQWIIRLILCVDKLHYTTTDRREMDHSRVGVCFACWKCLIMTRFPHTTNKINSSDPLCPA